MVKRRSARTVFDDSSSEENSPVQKKKNVQTKKIEIREFDLATINPASKILVIGKPGTGKSTLITAIAKTFQHLIPVARIFSGTEETNRHYEKHFPWLFITNELDLPKVRDALVRQRHATKENMSNPWLFLAIDDCADDPKLFKHKLFQRLFKLGRHWSTLFLLSLQYSMDVAPSIRGMADYVFILRETNRRNRKVLFDNYSASIDSFPEFCDLLDQLTTDYSALVIDNRGTTSNHLEDIVYYCKVDSDTIKNFKFGCPEAWTWNRDRSNPHYQEEIL